MGVGSSEKMLSRKVSLRVSKLPPCQNWTRDRYLHWFLPIDLHRSRSLEIWGGAEVLLF